MQPGMVLAARGWIYTRPRLLLQRHLAHPACSTSPCRAQQHHGCLSQHSKAEQGTATPFLVAFSLLPSYSCPSWCASAGNNQVVADGGTTKLHQRSATLGVRTAALKQNLQCHKSRWLGFLHPREFCTSCWQATTHGPVLNRSARRRSARKGVVGFLAEPGTMPKAAKSLSCFLLAYFTSSQRQLSRMCLVGAFLSPELIPVPKVQSPERFSGQRSS